VTGQNHVNRPPRFLADGLGGGNGLHRNAVQLTFPLLRDYQDPICHHCLSGMKGTGFSPYINCAMKDGL
jgi:hypothetical protein